MQAFTALRRQEQLVSMDIRDGEQTDRQTGREREMYKDDIEMYKGSGVLK